MCLEVKEKEMDERNCGNCAYCMPIEKRKGNGKCKNERSDSYDDIVRMTERCPDFEGKETDGFVTRGK